MPVKDYELAAYAVSTNNQIVGVIVKPGDCFSLHLIAADVSFYLVDHLFLLCLPFCNRYCGGFGDRRIIFFQTIVSAQLIAAITQEITIDVLVEFTDHIPTSITFC
jgi:hypothetical protein